MLLNKDGKFKKKVAPSVIHTYKVDFHTEYIACTLRYYISK